MLTDASVGARVALLGCSAADGSSRGWGRLGRLGLGLTLLLVWVIVGEVFNSDAFFALEIELLTVRAVNGNASLLASGPESVLNALALDGFVVPNHILRAIPRDASGVPLGPLLVIIAVDFLAAPRPLVEEVAANAHALTLGSAPLGETFAFADVIRVEYALLLG